MDKKKSVPFKGPEIKGGYPYFCVKIERKSTHFTFIFSYKRMCKNGGGNGVEEGGGALPFTRRVVGVEAERNLRQSPSLSTNYVE